MTKDVYGRLKPRFQIFDDVPMRKGTKREKCYIGYSHEVGFYKAAFIAGLWFPLSHLHRQLADYLGIFVYEIAPNAWSIFIGAEVLWGQLSEGNYFLTLEEFFYCYKP